MTTSDDRHLEETAQAVVIAFLKNNTVSAEDLPNFIREVGDST